MTESPINIKHAFESGRAASLNAQPRFACPFTTREALRSSWFDGYDQTKLLQQQNDPRGPRHG